MDLHSRIYDYINAGTIIVNLMFSIMYTFAPLREKYGIVFVLVEGITVGFFTILSAYLFSGRNSGIPYGKDCSNFQIVSNQCIL